MEIIDDKGNGTSTEGNTPNSPTPQSPLAQGFYTFVGILMIVIGFVWLGDNYNFLGRQLINTILSWQMLIVGVGVWLLCSRKWTIGAIVVATGVLLLLADIFHIYISFERLVLPVALMIGGAGLIFVKNNRQ